LLSGGGSLFWGVGLLGLWWLGLGMGGWGLLAVGGYLGAENWWVGLAAGGVAWLGVGEAVGGGRVGAWTPLACGVGVEGLGAGSSGCALRLWGGLGGWLLAWGGLLYSGVGLGGGWGWCLSG